MVIRKGSFASRLGSIDIRCGVHNVQLFRFGNMAIMLFFLTIYQGVILDNSILCYSGMVVRPLSLIGKFAPVFKVNKTG